MSVHASPPWIGPTMAGLTDDTKSCPDCGNRFVTANVWHSCETHTLEGLFVGAEPASIDLAKRYVSLLEDLGAVTVIPQPTRLTAMSRVRFAGLLPRKIGFVATFALREPLASKRVHKIVHHGLQWFTHHVRVTDERGLDDELRSWLQRAHDTVGLQS